MFEDTMGQQIISNSEVLSDFLKYAQQAENDAAFKTMALKLSKALAQQITSTDTPDAQLYLQDLTNLPNYLAFLKKHNERADDGNLLVHQSSMLPESPDFQQFVDSLDKSIYAQLPKHKDFFVHKPGILKELDKLEQTAEQTANPVMKVLVKNLISELQDANIDYQAHKAEPATQDLNTVIQQFKQKFQEIGIPVDRFQQVSHKIKPVSDREASETYKEAVKQLQGTLPFQSNQVISPLAITAFIDALKNVVIEQDKLFNRPNPGEKEDKQVKDLNLRASVSEAQQLSQRMSQLNTDLQRLIQHQISMGHSNLGNLAQNVPYPLGSNAFGQLVSRVGDVPAAKSVASLLNNMVLTAQEALYLVQRNRDLLELLNPSNIQKQLLIAQNFSNDLKHNLS